MPMYLSLAHTHPCMWSLEGPGPMHSFWGRENPTDQKYNPICGVWQLASIHGMPLPIEHTLAPPTGKANSLTPTEGALSCGDYTGWDGLWMEFSIIELPNPLKSVWHCKLPKRQTITRLYLSLWTFYAKHHNSFILLWICLKFWYVTNKRPFCFILLTHKGSHREVYQQFQPSYDIFYWWC